MAELLFKTIGNVGKEFIKEDGSNNFRPTEIYCEGWLLRSLIDYAQKENKGNSLLKMKDGSTWFSEALLDSPFAVQPNEEKILANAKKNKLGEGQTNVDGVIGNFTIRENTKAGFVLDNDAKKFIVIEAKLYSPLSSGVKHNLDYDQVTRNLACMAWHIKKDGANLNEIKDTNFFVMVPDDYLDRDKKSKIKDHMNSSRIVNKVLKRVEEYKPHFPQYYSKLIKWYDEYFIPFMHRLNFSYEKNRIHWKTAIEQVVRTDDQAEFKEFYKLCKKYNKQK